MSTFAVETIIHAPVEAVWATLADIGSIDSWNPGVRSSHTTSAQQGGVGASRHCDLGGKNYLDESVIKWEENQAITFQIDSTNMPFERCHIRFTLEESAENKTRVICSPEYKIKFGPLGVLLDGIMVKHTYRQGMQALLGGLRDHLEQKT